MSSDQDINKRLLDLLPVMLLPNGPGIDTLMVRARLDILDRQEQLLVIAHWLYDHREKMADIAFDMRQSDGTVYIEDDEVKVSDGLADSKQLVEDVVDLQQRLDSMADANTEAFLERVLNGLNKTGWSMPEAWHVLEKHAFTDGRMSGTDWLDQHRAAWEAQKMDQDTIVSHACPPARPRM